MPVSKVRHRKCQQCGKDYELGQNTMTEWIWSGSLYAFARVCNLRLDSHTQLETREVAQQISDYMIELFPESWNVLVK